MKQYEYYIFDFDGTLVDSFNSLYRIFATAYKAVGVEINKEDVILLSRISLVEGYKHFNAPLDKKNMDIFADVIRREVMSEQSIYDTDVYSETKEVINTLVSRGAKIAIATSNNKEHVRGVLNNLNIPQEYFLSVVGNDEVKNHKPAPDVVLKALEELGCEDKTRAIYIGDSINDVLAGENAGIDALLVERMNEYSSYTKAKVQNLKELL